MKLTLFTSPKPFVGDIGVIQRNAIRSWQLLGSECEVLLFGDEAGTDDVARDLSVRHIPEIIRNEHGTPRLDDLFARAQAEATHDLLCYVNADILLMSDFVIALDRLVHGSSPMLMVGRRIDLNLEKSLSFSNGWEQQLRGDLQQRGRPHSPEGIDYFVFRKQTFGEILPFALGRTVWDHWLIYRAVSRGVRVIDASPMVTAIHQNHDYHHHDGGKAGLWDGPEARQNRELAGRWPRVYDLRNAGWILTRYGLLPALTPYRVYRRLVHWLLCGLWSR